MKIIGHRGINQNEDNGKPYQNTVEAIEYSLNFSDGIELDVFLSKDEKCYVIHDNEIEKHSKFSKGNINDLTTEYLKKKYVGKKKKYNIPKLSEILGIFKKNEKILNIEIKQKGIQDWVIKELDKSKIDKERVIISSFNHDDLLSVRNNDKQLKIGLLFYKKEKEYEDYLINLGKDIGNFVYIPEKECEFKKINESEIEKYYWTFKKDDKALLNKIKKYQNANIVTDFPELYNENK